MSEKATASTGQPGSPDGQSVEHSFVKLARSLLVALLSSIGLIVLAGTGSAFIALTVIHISSALLSRPVPDELRVIGGSLGFVVAMLIVLVVSWDSDSRLLRHSTPSGRPAAPSTTAEEKALAKDRNPPPASGLGTSIYFFLLLLIAVLVLAIVVPPAAALMREARWIALGGAGIALLLAVGALISANVPSERTDQDPE